MNNLSAQKVAAHKTRLHHFPNALPCVFQQSNLSKKGLSCVFFILQVLNFSLTGKCSALLITNI